jgi:hypothetical protein
MGDDGRLVDPLTGQHKITAPTRARPRSSTVFGGAFANGGLAPSGKVSLVGERGPEMIVPLGGPAAVVPMGQMPTRKDTDGNVRPLTDFNPVNGRASSFDGMPRTQFFEQAMKADPTRGAGIGGGQNVYGDIRDVWAGQVPKADPRSFGTGGQNFMGPPAPVPAAPQRPPGLPLPPPPSAAKPATGMLVAGPGGSVKWQPGTGPLATLPPQRPQGMPFPALPGPVGLPTLPAKAAPFHDTGSAMDRHMSTGLAGSPRRQVGRSANDPTRIAEQMRRRGDPRAIMQLGMQRMGQDFARERDAVNFAQNQMMFDQHQAAYDARDARNFDQGLMMFELQQDAINARDERNFEQQQQIEAQRRAAELAAQERARQYGLKPLPVSGTQTPFFQDVRGHIYTGSQPERAPDPMPPGLVPKGYQNGTAIYGVPEVREPRLELERLPGEQVQDPVTKAWTTKPGQLVRVLDDNTYVPIQPRGQAKTSAAPAPLDPKARLSALRTKAGLK